jgi:hypothetical protein
MERLFKEPLGDLKHKPKLLELANHLDGRNCFVSALISSLSSSYLAYSGIQITFGFGQMCTIVA